MLDLSFLGFLFLPLALRWPENTKLGQEGGLKSRKLQAARGRVRRGRPPGTEAAGETDTTRYKYFRCLISTHHSAYLLPGREKLHIKALAAFGHPSLNTQAHIRFKTHTHARTHVCSGLTRHKQTTDYGFAIAGRLIEERSWRKVTQCKAEEPGGRTESSRGWKVRMWMQRWSDDSFSFLTHSNLWVLFTFMT